MTRARVLLAITKSELGGAQRYVEQLARLLPRYGFEAEVACGGDGWLVTHAKDAGAKVIQIRSLSLARTFRWMSELRALCELQAIIREGKYDVVHGNSTRAGFLARLAARRARTPVVVFSAHGFFFEEPMNGWRRVAYVAAERMAARWSDAIIMSSEIGRGGASRMGLCPAAKLVKIPYGLDEEETLRLSQGHHAAGLPSTAGARLGPLVGTVAGLYPAKGLEYLVTAMREVRKRIPEARAIIVGDGPERRCLDALVRRHGLEEGVTFLGSVPDAWGVLSAIDVFVLPSVKEGLPYALLEAMAVGKPIVATRVGGIPEVARDGRCALLVPPKDPQALSEAICQLIQDPAFSARLAGEARRAFLEEGLTAEAMVEATAALYRRLLTTKQSDSGRNRDSHRKKHEGLAHQGKR
jgi:glycosyltransferase involved in cell wall biosynthesis